MTKPETCELCEREDRLTRHHLIPRCRHKNKKNKKIFDRVEVKTRILWICRPCHSNIHAVLDEKELETKYNTKAKLLQHPGVGKFINWIRGKEPGFTVSTRKRKRR